jgi:peptidoglycan/LPS O-acetylase OafA/YrhL
MPDRPGNVSRAIVAGSLNVRTTMSVSNTLGVMVAVVTVTVAAIALTAIVREEFRRRRNRLDLLKFSQARQGDVARGLCVDCGRPMSRDRIRAGETTCGICQVGG